METSSKSKPSTGRPTALVISSSVAASRVGASASAFCLQRLGVEAIVLPTVLLGRHPGWGAPGGGEVAADTLRSMWDGIKSQNLKIDAVMTGYMASREHVALAAQIITDIRRQNPEAIILVDPVMGDNGKLYIAKAIATAIQDKLIPLADICTPNFWELGYISGNSIETLKTALPAARKLPCDVLITSLPFGQYIGAAIVQNKPKPAQSYYVAHEKFETVPHGGGDALAGVFLARLLSGTTPQDSLAISVASIFKIISIAAETGASEMPLIQAQDALITAAPLPLKSLS